MYFTCRDDDERKRDRTLDERPTLTLLCMSIPIGQWDCTVSMAVIRLSINIVNRLIPESKVKRGKRQEARMEKKKDDKIFEIGVVGSDSILNYAILFLKD